MRDIHERLQFIETVSEKNGLVAAWILHRDDCAKRAAIR
jgi:hypothetical protein